MGESEAMVWTGDKDSESCCPLTRAEGWIASTLFARDSTTRTLNSMDFSQLNTRKHHDLSIPRKPPPPRSPVVVCLRLVSGGGAWYKLHPTPSPVSMTARHQQPRPNAQEKSPGRSAQQSQASQIKILRVQWMRGNAVVRGEL